METIRLVSMRMWVWSRPRSVGQGSGMAMSRGVGHRHSLDPAILWLWCKLATVAPIWPLAWVLSCAASEGLKNQNKNKNKKERKWCKVPLQVMSTRTSVYLPVYGTPSCCMPATVFWRIVSLIFSNKSLETWETQKYLNVIVILFLFIYFVFLSFSRAALVAYGGSQARGLIGATAASLHQSHSNARSEPHLRTTP